MTAAGAGRVAAAVEGRNEDILDNGILKIGVVEHQGCRFPAEFESYSLEIALRGSFLYFSTNHGRTSEADFADLHVLGEELTSLASTRDKIDDSRGKACFDDEFAEGECPEW